MKTDIIYTEDCLSGMKKHLPDASIDLVATDPPYGIKFMGKSWDKALPSIDIWKETLRVLKPGAFAFVMCIPRQDCLARMIVSLEDAGFNISFSSIYHSFASGFPKAMNISLAIDHRECREQLEKRLGRKPTMEEFEEAWRKFRKVIGHKKNTSHIERSDSNLSRQKYNSKYSAFTTRDIAFETLPVTSQAKSLNGSFSGMQLKPAVEVVIVAMKPLSEKTYVDQALANRHGISWLDEGRIPYEGQKDEYHRKNKTQHHGIWDNCEGQLNRHSNTQGRFPANLICEGDVLWDGRVITPSFRKGNRQSKERGNVPIAGDYERTNQGYSDSGSFSRYFSLDAWWEKRLEELPESVRRTFPFLIVPKASKAEKNRNCEELYWEKDKSSFGYHQIDKKRWEWLDREEERIYKKTGKRVSLRARGNIHPTVKPLKLGSYLVTLGSRRGDTVLDPFGGSGWTAIVAKSLGRHYVVFETEKENVKIAKTRLSEIQLEMF